MAPLHPSATFTLPVSPMTLGHDTQKLVANKYCFHAPQPAITKMALVVSHSNGFNKETLEPMISAIVQAIHRQPQYQHTDLCVYSWDARNHGDSALTNRGHLLETYNWFDHTMDTKQILDYFELAEKYDAVVGVGHSYGATAMLMLEHMYPKSFNALCCIEPVLVPDIMETEVRAMSPILSSLKRRDTWPNRAAAFESLNGRGFWKTFDPEVLQLYVDTALYDTPEGTVMLKTAKEQEYHVFVMGYYTSSIAYHAVRGVLIPIHFIYADNSTYVPIDPVAELPAMNPKLVTCVSIPGTHMVPNEKPESIAPQVLNLLARSLKLSPEARL
ncbi:alpha/beta-hydrolase [Hesseltinella vesiculosa]|uniref:Alpha/beta-hydrolase n=1 Tax=Hesseltinella vesiculosa TaxID=101127 RepID=A0A1X2GAI3_9FUNG|nr:alpha/beta-hydrolase [Hesseltinella vesiculosa]